MVNDLLRWADDCETSIGLRVLSGPGGMGKTRTALETLSRADGWQQLWLSAKLPEDWIVEWQRWLEANNGARVWLVIDYADAQQDVLLRLLDAALECIQHSAGPAALRALMLTRNVTWWHELAHRPDCTKDVAALISGSANGGIEELPPWKNDPGVRATTYRAALEDYAAAQGRAVPEYAYLPDFSARAFERPLFLHLAALAALEGERPSHADSLLASQLDRERRYWQMRHPGLTCYDDWADALAWLGLMQGADVAHAEAVFADLGIARLACAFANTYPGEKGTIASLQPDLLVEALLRKRLTGTRGARLLDLALTKNTAASLAVIARLAAGVNPRGLQDAQPPHWQIALRDWLATAWPIHGQALIHAAHLAEIGLAHLLLQAWKILPEEAQERIAPALSLPKYSTPLIVLSTAITRAHLRAASSEAGRAVTLNNLGNRLSNQGDAASRTEALACAREAVGIRRELAQAQPSAYLPNLAMSLNNLATFLSKQGDAASRTEALARAREAVGIRRELAQAQPSAYLPNLATSLNNLATFLSEQGDAASRTKALACAREAVGIRRELAQEQPSAYLLDLAMSLNNLATFLSKQGDTASRTEALACAREAMKIYRELAQAQPSAYQPYLATSLNTLATCLFKQGDGASRTEALACAQEAVKIYRELAQAQPSAYLPYLAGSLNNLANCLSEQGDGASRTEALACAQEAVGIRRELAQAQPSAYLPDLAISLNNLANRLSEHGDAASRTEALACAREAVGIRRALAQAQPSAYLPDLAMSLNNLAAFLSAQGDAASYTKALACAREAMKIYRELAQAQPSAYLPDLAGSRNNLATFLSEQGDAASRTEALACAREAMGIYALFYEQMPTAYEHNLGIAVRTLSSVAQAIGLDAKAEVENAIRAMMPGEREGDGR